MSGKGQLLIYIQHMAVGSYSPCTKFHFFHLNQQIWLCGTCCVRLPCRIPSSLFTIHTSFYPFVAGVRPPHPRSLSQLGPISWMREKKCTCLGREWIKFERKTQSVPPPGHDWWQCCLRTPNKRIRLKGLVAFAYVCVGEWFASAESEKITFFFFLPEHLFNFICLLTGWCEFCRCSLDLMWAHCGGKWTGPYLLPRGPEGGPGLSVDLLRQSTFTEMKFICASDREAKETLEARELERQREISE